MAKSKSVCDRLHKSLKEIESHKMYLARVHGQVKFAEFVVDKPIKCVSKRLSKYETCELSEPTAKTAKTKFELLSYDPESDTSILRCLLTRFSAHWPNAPDSTALSLFRTPDCE